MSKKDFYEILGVDRSADEATIKKAYRKLAMKHHPDRTANEKDEKKKAATESKFKEITEAYETLSDQKKRQHYDQFGSSDGFSGMGGGAGPGGFGDIFEDIFSNFGDVFGGGGPQGRRTQARGGSDLKYNLELSLEEAVFGASVSIRIPTWISCDSCKGSGGEKGAKPVSCGDCHGSGTIRMQQGFFTVQQTCPSCGGVGKRVQRPCKPCNGQGRKRDERSLNVKIPAGINEGDRVRLSGKGEAGMNGGPDGDLYVEVHLKEHNIFSRDGNNLLCDVPVSIAIAALGGEVEVPTLSGEIKLKIPAESQTGKTFRLSGKGIKGISSSKSGDLLCKIVVETPVDLSRKQKELLQEFDSLSSSDKHAPRTSSWKDRVKKFLANL